MADTPQNNDTPATPLPPGPVNGTTAPPRFVGHALLVGVLTLASRITGLLRDAVLFASFGRGPVASAFLIGFTIPNLFRRLFGEGALSAAFIPAYAELTRNDPALAKRFASLCIAALLIVTGGITLLGEGVLWFMHTRDGWAGDTLLAIRLTMLMLPYMPLICLVALIGGALQVRGRFGPAASAPIFLNVVMIAAVLWATRSHTPDGTTDQHLRTAIVSVSMSVVLAGALQLVWQLAALFRMESPTLDFAGTAAAFKKMLWVMGPMVLGLAVFQINTALDTLIVWVLAPKEGGAQVLSLFGKEWPYPIHDAGQVAALAGAQRLYQFPLGVFGIALATAIFPALAHAAADRSAAGLADFRTTLHHGLRLSFFIGLPASVGLILVRVPLTRVVFEHGKFELEDSLRVAVILAGYASAVWAYSMTHILTRAFYAVGDSKTPLRVSMTMVIFNLAMNLTLIWPLGAAGLAWSTAISAACQVLILLLLVRRHVDQPVDVTVLKGWLRTVLLTSAMTASLGPLLLKYPAQELTWRGGVGLLGAMVLLGAAVVLIGAKLTGAEELSWLRHRESKATR